jgi:hypothetical protein
MTQKTLSIIFATLGWFAVITQYVLMMENRIASTIETSIRFFSFFTILTNSLVAFYFTTQSLNPRGNSFTTKSGTLTATTLYITIVGLVYQFVLRQIWDPQGLQKIVDELLHSVIPVCTLIYWWRYEQKQGVRFQQIPKWLIYPLAYLIFILIRGSVSDFYPYPFVNVTELGYQSVIINSVVLLVAFAGVAFLLVGIGRRLARAKNV